MSMATDTMMSLMSDTLPDLGPQFNWNFDEMALSFLSRKDREWQYEDEVRIIQAEEWYPFLTAVNRVIVGHRFNKALLRALRIVCERQSIALQWTSIENERVISVDCPDR
jgi:hypothetical protein